MVKWSRIVPYVWLGTIVVGVFGILPWGIYELHTHDQQKHVEAWFVAATFVALAVPITFWDVAQHLRHWYNPILQKKIIRILWMVPIYAVNSFLALRFVGVAIYLDTARECYEAYVIYNFYSYLLEYLRQRPDFDLSLTKRENQPHLFPLCCFKPWRMGQVFIDNCTHGVVSYIVVRPLTTIIALFCTWGHKYTNGDFEPNNSFVYLAVINSLSQAWAMYCLILFYKAFKHDLKAVNPLGKVLTIKAVVFLTFWQSVGIGFLSYVGVIKENPQWTTYNKETVSASIQDFLICVEMFVASLVHHKVFSYREFWSADGPREYNTFWASMKHLFDVQDVREQVFDHIHVVSTLPARMIKKKSNTSIETPLLEDHQRREGAADPIDSVPLDSVLEEVPIRPPHGSSLQYGTMNNS